MAIGSMVEALPANGVERVTARPSVFYHPELDVLRFLAFSMVFVHHCPFPASHPALRNVSAAGGYGVCIFFLLSAYLITELLMRERERTGSIHIKAFFIRRALRIWPLYFLAVALGVGVGELVPAWHVSTAAIPYLLLIAGNFFVAHAGWQLGVIGPLWSLSVEEQFYLLIPTLMKLGNRRALLIASILCLPVAYLALAWLGYKRAIPQTGVWINSLVQFQFFAAGTLLALFLHARDWSLSTIGRLFLGGGGILGLVLTERLFLLQSDIPASSLHLCLGYAIVFVSCVSIFLGIMNAPFKALGSWFTSARSPSVCTCFMTSFCAQPFTPEQTKAIKTSCIITASSSRR